MASLRERVAACDVIAAGGIIAYPTEAVYGYGCDPFNADAVIKLLALKRRPWHKGLILVAADTAQLNGLLAPLSPSQRATLEASWPGPTTWVIPDRQGWAPPWIRGRFQSVAVRISAHPEVRALCSHWGGPIVSTSANRSGDTPAVSEWSLRRASRMAQRCRRLPQQPDFVVGGHTLGLSKPTQIIDLLTGQHVRA